MSIPQGGGGGGQSEGAWPNLMAPTFHDWSHPFLAYVPYSCRKLTLLVYTNFVT